MTKAEVVNLVLKKNGVYRVRLDDFEKAEEVEAWYSLFRPYDALDVFEAADELFTESKWPPTPSEIIARMQDIRYGEDDDIIKGIDRRVRQAVYVGGLIDGVITDNLREGWERLTDFQKAVCPSPEHFAKWMHAPYEAKLRKVKRAKKSRRKTPELPDDVRRRLEAMK